MLPTAGAIVDLGSGGGIPGLPLVTAGVGSRWALLDGSVTRCRFLSEAVARLSPAQAVEVICGRAEEVGRDEGQRGQWDAVIARSFGRPATTAECAAPLLAVGGVLVVAEPPSSSPGRWPPEGLALLGLEPETLFQEGQATYQVLRQTALCPPRFPRRVGVPAKRPLF